MNPRKDPEEAEDAPCPRNSQVLLLRAGPSCCWSMIPAWRMLWTACSGSPPKVAPPHHTGQSWKDILVQEETEALPRSLSIILSESTAPLISLADPHGGPGHPNSSSCQVIAALFKTVSRISQTTRDHSQQSPCSLGCL